MSTSFKDQQHAISEQFQLVLEARLKYHEATQAHSDARHSETAASNVKNNAHKKLVSAQAALDALLKPGAS